MSPWFLLLGCSQKPVDPTPTAPPTDTADTDPPTLQPFGLDTRPSNPSCVAPSEGPLPAGDVQRTQIWSSVSLDGPVALTLAPGDDDHWYAIEQSGRVKRFDGSQTDPIATTVLTLTDIDAGGEKGLLGIAFSPSFASDGWAYLSYTANDGGLESRLSRFQTTDGGATWDLGSEQILMTVGQPFGNHNGGHIAFGPDGMLYWGLGDGGSGGDPQDHGQRLDTVLGAMLRLDVSGASLAIPEDNPFVDTPGARGEIWAYGLRNPWRWSFDPVTGELWLGDVGQDAWEEIDLLEAGGNYGWRIREGAHCYDPLPCDPAGLIDPVVDYAQGAGRSVVGGVVYRGSDMPALQGTYLFADYYDGNVYAVVYDAAGQASMETVHSSNRSTTHITVDAAGEVLLLDRPSGAIDRLEPVTGSPVDPFPQTLTESGCFAAGQPTPGLVPYSINHAFWSDGAEKERWMALPDAGTIDIESDGDLSFPVGTVLVKSFESNGVQTETRLFMHHSTDRWAGYTYKWRADGSDADLLVGADTVDAPPDTWTIPGRASCVQCHTMAAGHALGPEIGQLARSQTYPATGRTAPQLDTLEHIGLFAGPVPPLAPFPSRTAGDLTDRARTYLHVNCSGCHRPDGPALGDLDLHRDTTLAQTGLCGPPTQGDLGLPDAGILGDGPANSVLLARMNSQGAYRMPPIATEKIDDVGGDLIADWIASDPCP